MEITDGPPMELAAKKDQERSARGKVHPHRYAAPAESTVHVAVEIADLVLIPYRRSVFDLLAIQRTTKLAQLLRNPPFAVFTSASPDPPRMYQEAGELVDGFGTRASTILTPGRAVFRYASA